MTESVRPDADAYDAAAAYYDLHVPKNEAAMLAFWTFAVAQHARRPIVDVLEFAVGTGRFAIPLSGAGYRVVGTDVSETMIALCQEKAKTAGVSIELRREWMQDFADENLHDALVAIFGAPAFLVDHAAIRQFFRRCRAGLRPGGFLLVDVANSLEGLTRCWAGLRHETFEADGVRLDRSLELTPDTVGGTVRYHATNTIQREGRQTTQEEDFVLRMFTLPEIELLMASSGFARLTCYGEWTHRTPRQPGSRLILVAEA